MAATSVLAISGTTIVEMPAGSLAADAVEQVLIYTENAGNDMDLVKIFIVDEDANVFNMTDMLPTGKAVTAVVSKHAPVKKTIEQVSANNFMAQSEGFGVICDGQIFYKGEVISFHEDDDSPVKVLRAAHALIGGNLELVYALGGKVVENNDIVSSDLIIQHIKELDFHCGDFLGPARFNNFNK
jgi:hypothetical protein